MRFRQGTHLADVLFTLSLFCVFAASSLMVVTIGANVYKGTIGRMNQNFDTRASLTYITNKVRQNDRAGSVRLGELEGLPALVLTQEIGGRAYSTWIYHYEGALREIFSGADNPVKPSDGRSIVAVASFSMEQAGDGLYAFTSVDAQGRSVSVRLRPRCG